MSTVEYHKQLRVHFFNDQTTMLSWLERHHDQEESVWIKLAKKNTSVASVTYEEAREAAIIYGWIDGLINGLDQTYYLIKFSPRRKRSKWSKINRGIAQELIGQRRMQPAGLRQVQAAKEDGRWQAAYDSPRTIKVPPEMQRRLNRNKQARDFFESLGSANRYAFLYRIQNAKREETKRKQIEKTMEMLIEGKTYHPQIRKKK